MHENLFTPLEWVLYTHAKAMYKKNHKKALEVFVRLRKYSGTERRVNDVI